MDNEVYVMVFVRYSCGDLFTILFEPFELLWNTNKSALVILTENEYKSIRESIIIQKGRHCITEIQLIKPKR